MAGTDLTDFIPDVSSYVKGADKAENQAFLIAQTLRTVRDFCKKTWIWRETLTKIDVVEDDGDYVLSPGTDNCDSPEVHWLDWVKYKVDGQDDDQFTYLTAWNLETEEVDTSTGISAGFVNTSGDAPQVFWMDPEDILNIRPTPNATAAGTANMQVKAILSPKLDATTVPTILYDDWIEAIAFGAAARIMKMAGKKWYNPELAKFYEREYLKKRNDETRMQRWEGRVRTQGHVKIHRGFTGGHRQRNWIF